MKTSELHLASLMEQEILNAKLKTISIWWKWDVGIFDVGKQHPLLR